MEDLPAIGPEEARMATVPMLLPEVVPTAREESLRDDDFEMELRDPEDSTKRSLVNLDAPVDVRAVEEDAVRVEAALMAASDDSVSPRERKMVDDVVTRLLRTLQNPRRSADASARATATRSTDRTLAQKLLEIQEEPMEMDEDEKNASAGRGSVR